MLRPVVKYLPHVLVSLLLCISVGQFQAQDIGPMKPMPKEKEPYSIWDHLFYGGGLGAQFGNYTLINVSPMLGYKITERWSIGVRTTYNYINIKTASYVYEGHVYGGSGFSRFFIFDNFFAHTEYEVLNGNWRGTQERFNVPSWFVGGGYLYRLSDYAGIGITALYNLTPGPYTPYRNPIINVGFTYGL